MQLKNNDLIFIFSQHRTGSTLLKNILNESREVTMSFDEMNLYEPFRKNTFDKVLKKNGLKGDTLINLIKQKKIYGTFWQEFQKSKIDIYKLGNFYDSLQNSKLSKTILYILNEQRKINNTKFSGVKYPTHFYKMNFIFKSFRNSKCIFLTRNPFAIYASKVNDIATKKRIKRFGFIIRYFTLIYVCFEYIVSYYFFLKYKSKLIIISYEDLVMNQNQTIKKTCNYVGIKYDKNMINATGKMSSFIVNDNGIYHESLIRFKKILSPLEKKIIKLITNKHYKLFLNELHSDI